MNFPIHSLRATAPTTTDQLAQDAYHAYAKERTRLGGAKAPEWERLSQAETKGWQQATSAIASHVAFTGCPRPLDLAGGVCEAKRCAEWLLHLADGGDVGSDAQLRMLLRTAAGLLVRPEDPGGFKSRPVAQFDALRRALADLPRIEAWHIVGAPWGQGDFVVAGHPDPHIGTYVADTENCDGEGEHSLEYAAFIAAANPEVVQRLLRAVEGSAS
ncbi:hypothetical protein [Acidovorax sp. NCPPB 3576]|uniref:hypothetical protein n=1 Tax=Acidovorax sp. NCPPB 3576 TaxID=2940488 RepID=UPI00234B7557|nr:hypothetical protein [Acidovorax sp. NCPPB 3576]WCM88536.1 hypothetical protein M5C98_00270 [Acidovorax sp. NCPPB 3576]